MNSEELCRDVMGMILGGVSNEDLKTTCSVSKSMNQAAVNVLSKKKMGKELTPKSEKNTLRWDRKVKTPNAPRRGIRTIIIDWETVEFVPLDLIKLFDEVE